MVAAQEPVIPSWLRWPPNSCETCVGWERLSDHTGTCQKHNALDVATITDSRYRCPSFQRKPDDDRTNQITADTNRA